MHAQLLPGRCSGPAAYCSLLLCAAAADVEDISAKTGSFKKFPVFVKMLLSGIKQQSDSVFVDLLTYADLEQLKAKKTGQPPAAARNMPANNKRYLIVTYAAEFDRVHYPLPLHFDEHPDPARLKVSSTPRPSCFLHPPTSVTHLDTLVPCPGALYLEGG